MAVDDESQARDLISTLLRKYGASVTLVSSSAEAIEILSKKERGAKIDLVVSDIGMPEENGYTLIRRIRRLPEPVGKIPAIALTAYGRSEDRIRALEAGFQMHVAKPVEPTELMMVIASLTGRYANVMVD
jgi:CheY-like chemotaxis protein